MLKYKDDVKLSNVVEIEYKPLTKIVVHEIIKYDLQQFIQLKTAAPAGQRLDAVKWIDGIVFQAGGYPPTPDIVKDGLEGIVHWSVVEFAEMPDYVPVLTNSNTGASAPVIDNSANTAVSDFIRWLKRQKQWFPSA